jgi:hypothetical protein
MITSSVVFDTGLVLSGSSAVTGSYFLWNGNQIVTALNLVTTTSFQNFTSSYNTGSFTGSFNGNLQGTSSYSNLALLALTSSYYVNPFIYILNSNLGKFSLGVWNKSAPAGGFSIFADGTLQNYLPNTQSEALVQHPAPYPCRVIGLAVDRQNGTVNADQLKIYVRKNGVDTDMFITGSLNSGVNISYNTQSNAIFGFNDLMSLRIYDNAPGAGDYLYSISVICCTNL